MSPDELIQELEYAENPSFVKTGTSRFKTARDYGHIFRHAAMEFPNALGKGCRLLGVYTLSSEDLSDGNPQVPIIYVCKADTPQNASHLHRLVWNQDVVPFVLVHTPAGLILHSGFHFERTKAGGTLGILRPLTAFNDVHDLIADFQAASIDSGRIWKRWQHVLRPEKRVDWKLLDNLQKLEERLRDSGVHRETSHALIGKYVFLHYLKDRGILSLRKMESWGILPNAVFGRSMSLVGLRTCIDRLDEWLNGSVFPITWNGSRAPKQDQVRAVASVFAGDEPVGSDLWQLAFDFQAYNFSYIPIETLSVIYEQFLHTPDEHGKKKGRERGAYYTPLPLVNLMLAELEKYKPIGGDARLLDPSCGSGTFLVQAYRRLIEREYPATAKARPTPAALRDLLTSHIYGVDSDADACSVTELSLLLTLLDYVDPPDLEQNATQKRFHLPTLREANVFCADFFDNSSEVVARLQNKRFDFVIGNPPWKSLNPKKLDAHDKNAYEWLRTNGKEKGATPVGGNQIAQAFTWRIKEFMNDVAEVAFLIPGMTLFENRSRRFRRALFNAYAIHEVINFANLAEVLFAGRSRVPAAALFFTKASTSAGREEESIRVFSPLVANQEANRPTSEHDRSESWNIVVNESEIRHIPAEVLATGDGMPWKLAMWGSERDVLLLQKLERRFDNLRALEKSGIVTVSQGLELRDREGAAEELEEVSQVIGKPQLDVTKLARLRHVFRFPKEATASKVPSTLRFARKGRVSLPLRVCQPPSVIVSAARTFAVYSDQFIIVPPRQIGIVSNSSNQRFLKALSLYLSSDFAFYHQFLTSTQFGVKRDVATLRSLRRMPIPLANLPVSELNEWVALHEQLVTIAPARLESQFTQSPSLFPSLDSDQLLRELNERACDALGLSARERLLVHDLCHVRLSLNDGKIGRAAVGPPNQKVLRRFARRLRDELDGFVAGVLPKRHNVTVVHDDLSAMVVVDLVPSGGQKTEITVAKAGDHDAKEMAKTRERLCGSYAQWVYFNRNLRIYEKHRTFVLKPMQTFHWTEGQAMADAADIIAETLSQSGDVS